MRDYQHNKAPKDRDLLKLIRKAIKKDCLRNGFDFEDFASELGLSVGTLDNKLRPANDVNVLSLDEFIHILDITADYEPLEYIAKRYGFRLCKPDDIAKNECENIVMSVTIKALDLEALQGDLAKTIKESIEDGVVDDEEKKAIKDLAYQLRKLAAELEESLK